MTSHKNLACHALISTKEYVTSVKNVAHHAIFFSTKEFVTIHKNIHEANLGMTNTHRTLPLPVKIVSQVNTDEYPSRGGVDTHVVSSVVKVLCACVSFNVVGIVVSPTELYINPVLLGRGAVHNVTAKDEHT